MVELMLSVEFADWDSILQVAEIESLGHVLDIQIHAIFLLLVAFTVPEAHVDYSTPVSSPSRIKNSNVLHESTVNLFREKP